MKKAISKNNNHIHLINPADKFKTLWDEEVSILSKNEQDEFFKEIWNIGKISIPPRNRKGLKQLYDNMPYDHYKMAFFSSLITIDEEGNIIN